MALSITVSPSSAKVNETLTFTIIARNNGSAPGTDVVLSNSFPAYIDVSSVSTTKGAASKSSHSISATFGELSPNEQVQVVIVTKVNGAATRTETVSDVPVLTYNGTLSVVASVNFTVIATSTLPNTGEIPLDALPGRNPWLAASLLLAGSLLLGAAIALKARFASVRFFTLLLVFSLVLVALAACLPAAPASPTAASSPLPQPSNTATLLPYRPAYMFSTPEAVVTLPAFPIPSPTLVPTAQPGQPAPDTSPVVRIVVPALNLDTDVKYVPLQELTWYITGLRTEVAWLGNTSWPGLGGNTVLAAHVTVAGLGDGPFRWLETLKNGDVVTLYTEQNIYTYVVRDQIIVESTDMGIADQTVRPQLTLLTCTGWDTDLELYRYRRAVFADLTRTEPWKRGSHR